MCTLIEIVVVDDKIYNYTCLSCNDDKTPVFRSDCRCYDLMFCSDCWKEWLLRSPTPHGILYRAKGRAPVIHCVKCHMQSFVVVDGGDSRMKLTSLEKFIVCACTTVILNFFFCHIVSGASLLVEYGIFYAICVLISRYNISRLEKVEIPESSHNLCEMRLLGLHLKTVQGKFLEFD